METEIQPSTEKNAENALPTSSPDSAVTSQPTEHAGSEVATAETGLRQKIADVAAATLEKVAVVVKPGRGRPRKDGSPKASDVVEAVAPDASGPAAPAPAPGAAPGAAPAATVAGPAVGVPAPGLSRVSPALLSRCVARATKGLLAVPNYFLKKHHRKAGRTPEQIKAIVASCSPDEQEIEDLTELAKVAFKNADVDPEAAVKLLGTLTLANMAGRYVEAFNAAETKEPAPKK